AGCQAGLQVWSRLRPGRINPIGPVAQLGRREVGKTIGPPRKSCGFVGGGGNHFRQADRCRARAEAAVSLFALGVQQALAIATEADWISPAAHEEATGPGTATDWPWVSHTQCTLAGLAFVIQSPYSGRAAPGNPADSMGGPL